MVAIVGFNQKIIKKTPWKSIYLCCFIMMLSGFNMTMFTTSVWPYLESLTKKPDVQWLGWSLAALSVGSMIASPALGWMQQNHNTKTPLILAFSFSVFGNLLYGMLPTFGEQHLFFLLIGSRVLLGFTSSAISLLRTYAAVQAVEEERQTASCYVGVGLSIGLSLGPVIQASFISLGSNFYQVGPFLLNEFTAPAFMMTLTSLLIMAVVALFFHEDSVKEVQTEKKSNGQEGCSTKKGQEGSSEEGVPLPCSKKGVPLPSHGNKFGLIVLFYIWCLLMTAATSEYAIAAPLTMAMYGWSGEEVVSKHGLIQTIQCLSAASTNLIIILTKAKNIDLRKQLLFAMSLLLTASLSLFPWPFYEKIPISPTLNSTVEVMPTCENDTRVCVGRIVPLPLYVVVMALFYGPATTIGLSTSNALVSLVLDSKKQGFVQGWMGSAGAFSSLIVPIVAAYLFSKDGTRTFSIGNATLYLLAIVLILKAYKKLKSSKTLYKMCQ